MAIVLNDSGTLDTEFFCDICGYTWLCNFANDGGEEEGKDAYDSWVESTAEELADEHDCEPGDDDVVLGEFPDEAKVRELLVKFDQDRFWPNVWVARERGGFDLITLCEDGQYNLVV